MNTSIEKTLSLYLNERSFHMCDYEHTILSSYSSLSPRLLQLSPMTAQKLAQEWCGI